MVTVASLVKLAAMPMGKVAAMVTVLLEFHGSTDDLFWKMQNVATELVGSCVHFTTNYSIGFTTIT